MLEYVVDPAFLATSHRVGVLELCEVRLQDDSRWPWLILVPRLPGLREIEDLRPKDRVDLMDEVICAGKGVRALGSAQGRPVEKLNVGALGNLTPQLHVHVIGRRGDDPAWPGPAWGFGQITRYDDDRREAALLDLKVAMGL